ncbi:MAG: SDR family NAD(P)-dependent oxidoreductase, partial [Candidatus Marinimicrobia bacterium]|nr:SDR family NAD(P)-dependent oxidoreductase [Candidatus Neomarinimicrobiota bacterium]
MNMQDKKVVLITGASSGIGKACADYLHESGYRVYGTSRSGTEPERIDFDSLETYPLLKADVNDQSSVDSLIDTLLGRESKIDVLLNNAGISSVGAMEDFSMNEIRTQMETNFFGAVRMIQAALPGMREQRSGLIINMSSIGGVMGLPFQAFYSASKFALEGVSESLRLELHEFGIKVVVIQPGNYDTPITENRTLIKKSQVDSAYARNFKNAYQVIRNEEKKGHSPLEIGQLVAKIIRTPKPKLRYMVGPLNEKMVKPYKT